MICQGWRFFLILTCWCSLTWGCQTASRAPAPDPPLSSSPPADGSDAETAVEGQPTAPAAPPASSPDTAGAPELLPAPSELSVPLEDLGEESDRGGELSLSAVVSSVVRSYPLLVSQMLERPIADGKQLAAWGEFDLRARADAIAAPEGFYQTYRNSILVDQPLFNGGYVFGGYKIGDGNFEPWFGERETNEGGEFSVGLGLPLLKNRAIDKRRAVLFQAELARQAVEPVVRLSTIEFVRLGAQAYWNWVAAGRTLAARRELLRNGLDRVRQIAQRVEAGDLERIARINNEQLIAARETKVIEAERKVQQAAIKLSLFYRGSQGEPVIPAEHQLPRVFPGHAAPDGERLEADVARAIAASPELNEIELIAAQVRVELDSAQNMLLPKFDALVKAAQDVGGAASSKRDKSPFQFETGFYGEVPVQRREARGKIEAARGKLAQIETKRRFVVNKITAAVQDALSALEAAANRIDQAGKNLSLARETLDLGRLQFQAGDIGVVTLNIYEQAVTDAELLLISAQADYFSAVADYRAALALDPLAAT